MVHGSAGYFRERARVERRVALLSLFLSLGGLATLLAFTIPAVRRVLPDSSRFGFEGPEQYVRRVTLDRVRGQTSTLADVGRVGTRTTLRGGGRAASPSRARVGQPNPKSRELGPGTDDFDLARRATSHLAGVPVFQSEELIIDRLVRPQYPPALLEKNVEGKVTLQALVDTVGLVVEVEVLSSTGESLFEDAAEQAVMQCRFRPYRFAGSAIAIYAVFTFSFRIY